jgi:hypothetical protein
MIWLCAGSAIRTAFAANSTKEDDMGDHGNRDKGGREQKKKAKLSLKEKRKQKHEKKQNVNVTTI